MPDANSQNGAEPPSAAAEIDAWASGRSPSEEPAMAPNPSTGGDGNDPEDGAVELPPGGPTGGAPTL